jgi:hypothetical protein
MLTRKGFLLSPLSAVPLGALATLPEKPLEELSCELRLPRVFRKAQGGPMFKLSVVRSVANDHMVGLQIATGRPLWLDKRDVENFYAEGYSDDDVFHRPVMVGRTGKAPSSFSRSTLQQFKKWLEEALAIVNRVLTEK